VSKLFREGQNMGFKKRLGTALRNINDIQVYGYPKNEQFHPEHQIEIEDKRKFPLNIDEADIDNLSGWEIKTDTSNNE